MAGGPDYARNLLLEKIQQQINPTKSRWVNKYGANEDIDTASVPEFIWTPGGTYSWPSTATAMEIVSTSTADRSPSSGAYTVFVQGLGSSAGTTQSETVTLNGQSAVALVNKYYRVNRAYLKTAGSHEKNVGKISIRDSGGGTTHANIIIGEGQTLIGLWTVPSGKIARIRRVWAQFPTVSNRSNAACRLHFRTGGVVLTKHRFVIDTTLSHYEYNWPIGGPEAAALTDIYIGCDSVASNNTAIEAGFDVSIEDA